MNQSYVPLATVTLQHRYFPGSRARHLRLEPDFSAVSLARSAGLIIKYSNDGLMIAANVRDEAPRAAALAMHLESSANAPDLWFRLADTDPVLRQCTAGLPKKKDTALMFATPDQPLAGSNAVLSLTSGDTASQDDSVALDSDALAAVLTTHDRLIPPLAFVRLSLGDLIDPAGIEAIEQFEQKQFMIRFDAPETRWRYILVGDHASGNVEVSEITDDDGATGEASLSDTSGNPDASGHPTATFTARRETLQSGRDATTFLSDQSIALRLQQPRRFVLRDGSNGDVLINRLPVAAPEGLMRTSVDGQEMDVSDIYIHY